MERELNNTPVKLILSGDVLGEMERRGLCETDIRQVISFAEETSSKLVNTDTGRYIAHLKIGNITCWTEYMPTDGGYRIFKAYAHRMDIEEGR